MDKEPFEREKKRFISIAHSTTRPVAWQHKDSCRSQETNCKISHFRVAFFPLYQTCPLAQSYKNMFHLQLHFHPSTSFSYERFPKKTRFETDTQGHSGNGLSLTYHTWLRPTAEASKLTKLKSSYIFSTKNNFLDHRYRSYIKVDANRPLFCVVKFIKTQMAASVGQGIHVHFSAVQIYMVFHLFTCNIEFF